MTTQRVSRYPACPTIFNDGIPATLDRSDALLPPIRVFVIGLETAISYDVENERHYKRAMALTSWGTKVGLRRVRFHG